LLRIGAGEPDHHAVLLPELNFLVIDKPLGAINGCGVMLAIQLYGFDESAVRTDDVCADNACNAFPATWREHVALQSPTPRTSRRDLRPADKMPAREMFHRSVQRPVAARSSQGSFESTFKSSVQENCVPAANVAFLVSLIRVTQYVRV
jgi:hypothetical protein